MERLVKIGFICGLVIYFLFAVMAKVPAQWATKAIIDAVPTLKLGSVSGTVWKGQADSAIVVVQGQTIDLGGLAWEVDAWSLLSLSVCADVNSGFAELNACRSLSGVNSIKNLIVDQVPASLLNKAVGFAKIEGNFSLTVKSASLNDKGIVKQLDGTLLWDGARGDAGGGWFELGGFMVSLSEDGEGGLVANISDTSGGFEIALKGGYMVGGEPSLSGLVIPRPEANQQLVDSLGFLTEALDDGSFRVTWPM